MTRQRLFDWRFVAAITVLLLSTYLIWNGFAAQREVHVAGHRADVLIQRLQDQEHDAAVREASDDVERQQLLAQQADLLAKYGQLEASQRHLLRWLRAHGIKVPTRYVIVPRVVHRSASPHASRSRHKHAGTTPPAAQSVPTPRLPNGKPAPGNSGNAPGHQKH